MPAKPKEAKWAASPIVVDEVRYQFDGRGIVEPSYRHVFVVPAAEAHQELTDGDYSHDDLCGRLMAVTVLFRESACRLARDGGVGPIRG